MLENRLGGLVNVRRPDSIAPLPQNNLNPFVFEVLKQLSADKEEHGYLRALQGSQQGRHLVAELARASGQHDAGRWSASEDCRAALRLQLLHPLMIEVIRLAIVNEAPEEIIEVAGAAPSDPPKLWTERKTCTVSCTWVTARRIRPSPR
jgi:hypothetical protein